MSKSCGLETVCGSNGISTKMIISKRSKDKKNESTKKKTNRKKT